MLKSKKDLTEINLDLKRAIKFYKRLKFEEAQIIFSKILEKDPINPEAHYYLGLIHSKKEEWNKAIIHLKTIIDIGINFIFTNQCRLLLGIIYFNNHEYERAENIFLEALNHEDNKSKIYSALSSVYYYMNEKEKALSYAKKAVEADNYNLTAKNNYGFLLADYNIDILKSIEILREVVRLKPTNPAYLDSLGWAYYKKGDYKAAKASLEEALKYAKDSKEIISHLKKVEETLRIKKELAD